MHNILRGFPPKGDLIKWYTEKGPGPVLKVNCHIHSPYSFSAFDDLEQAFSMAAAEDVKVLGINDFNTTEGYSRFYELGLAYRVFPLFNIEFMGLLEEEQRKGVRINDPNNPGRIYFCGKGLDFPVSLSGSSSAKITSVTAESHRQVREMTARLNDLLQSAGSSERIGFDEVREKLTMGMVRERHLARALRLMIFQKHPAAGERKMFLKDLFGGTEPAADPADVAALENELRGRLLKSGGPAFVEEDSKAFLDIDEICGIIADAGGIPCYPVLLDDAGGNCTEFESDLEALSGRLRAWDVPAVELIPGRNSPEAIRRFTGFFRDKGFVVMFGTEHNTPALQPLKVAVRGGGEPDPDLAGISYLGACLVAAHQYLRAKGETGYAGFPVKEEREEFEELGKAVIARFIEKDG
ncbi:MAG: hypothetical protein EA408_09800 [Marinilabiliales bacterium]|nr:MAG: hypothetical protein EA408_09800 [Marinilabiliales bacterium]